jgi:hypothetical protein
MIASPPIVYCVLVLSRLGRSLRTLHTRFDISEQFFEGHALIQHSDHRWSIESYRLSGLHQPLDGSIN